MKEKEDISAADKEFLEKQNLRASKKRTITIRLDADVLDWFRGQGRGYQTRINKLLRSYMEAHQDKEQ